MLVQPRSSIRNTRLSAFVLASAVAAVALPHAAFGQSRTFTGGGDGTTYNLSTNWSPADVPDTAAETAIIDAGGAFNVTLGTTLSVGGLTIGSDDSLTQANNTSFTITGPINNAGSLVLNSVGNLTDLIVAGASLSGNGTLTLVSLDRVRGSGLFTNNSTIQGGTDGGGSLGTNELSITNSATGLVNANVNGSTLNVDPATGTGTFINAGTLRASNGGILLLNGNGGGTFNNAGGTIQAQNGSSVALANGATITGGTLTTVGTGTINTSNATIANLINAGSLVVANNTGLTLSGTITNNGTILGNSAGNLTDITTDGSNVTLNGSGTVTLQSADRIRGGGTLTNNSTIQGETSSGSIGANELSVTNSASGLINANVSGASLIVDPVAGTGTFINAGNLRASGGGILQLTGSGGGTFNNAGGTIQAQNASSVALVGSVSVTGGTLTTAGTGTINTTNATLVGLTNAGSMVVTNNTTLTLSGTITNNGTILANSSGNLTDINTDGTSATLAGTGTVTLQSAARIGGGGTFTNNSTIQGETSGGSIGVNNTNIVNTGTINANSATGLSLVLDPLSTGSLINTATLKASGGGRLVLTGSGGGDFANTGGTIQALAGSIVRLDAGASVTGGSIGAVGTGSVETNNATLTGLTTSGTVNVLNNTTLTLVGTIVNNGAINLNSIGNITELYTNGADVTLSGTGTVNLTTAARIRGGGTFTNNITLQGDTNNGTSIGTNDTTLVNNGLIIANTAGTVLNVDPGTGGLTNNGTLRASGTGTLVLTGSGGGAFTNTGHVIEALAGSQVRLNAGVSITGGTLSSTGGGTFSVDNSSSATLANLTNASPLTVVNNATLTLVGTINNTGSMTFASIGNFTDLYTNGADVTLTGGGTINLTTAARVRGGGTFTNTNNTIQGDTNASSIGSNDTTIVNNALINANNSGLALVLDPGTGGLTNTSTLQASNGGILVVTGSGGGAFTNTGGTIQALTGSQVQLTSTAAITGGTISSTGTGTVIVPGSSSATLNNLTTNAAFTVGNNSTLTLVGTITNNGSILMASAGNFTDLYTNGANVTLAGTGTLTLQVADRIQGGGTFTNNSTIQGETSTGSVGTNNTDLVNNGLINANSATGLVLDLDPSPTLGYTNSATGITRASGGGTLRLNGSGGGSFTNNGTFEALNASTFTFANGATLTNSTGGSLTGGIYRSIATNPSGTSTLNLPGGNISVNAADVTISGTGSVFTQIDSITQTTSAGAFRVLDGRNFTTVGNYTNTGITQLGGGTFTATPTYNNLTTGETFGFGTIANRIVNSGIVRASGGTLAVNGIDPATTAGTAQSDSGATLSLAASTSASTVNALVNNGNLALGAQNVLVRTDYTNASFGVGNAFNPRANVTGAGLINASPAVAQTITGAAVTNGATATPTLALGNLRVGSNVSSTFTINNVGATGPSLRGAIQTTNAAGFGGNVTDGRLSGSGTAAANFGPIAAGSSTAAQTVTFTGTTAGALIGQKIAVVNNFDNVTDQQIALTGTAYNPAVASVTPPSVFVGNFHVGDAVAGSTITFANTAPAGAFSEDLAVTGVAATGTAALGVGSPTSFNVLAGANNTAVKAAVNTTTAGAKSGNVTANLLSNATVNSVAIPGLSPISVGSASVAVTGNVYRLAAANTTTPVNLGDKHVGDVANTSITVNNTATADGFSESLAATASIGGGDVTAASGSTTIAPGANSGSALTATLSTASAGAKSGTVNVGLSSIGAAAGLGNTALTGQTATVTANVYNLAAPVINNSQPVAFGIVHVGDAVTPVAVSIKNNAPAGSFSEKLNAAAGAAGAGLTGTGTFTGLVAQGTNASGITVGINTASAAVITSNLPITFASDGSGINSLGLTPLASQTLSVTAQVNNYAVAKFNKVSGSGTFSSSGTSYSLDLGTVPMNSTSPQAQLSLLNNVLTPADTLAGGYTIVASHFITSGFTSFTGLTAGSSLTSLLVGLDTSTVGSFTGTITLAPRSQNTSGYDGALSNVVLNLQGVVSSVPEPTSMGLIVLAGSLTLSRRRRD